jgi:ubiquitin-protein ligase
MSSYATELLRRQLLDLSRNPPDGVSVGLGEDDNMFVWEVMIVGPPDTLYEGGLFKAKLEFPPDFPNAPPVMTFLTPIWHPNGIHPCNLCRMCLSILIRTVCIFYFQCILTERSAFQFCTLLERIVSIKVLVNIVGLYGR